MSELLHIIRQCYEIVTLQIEVLQPWQLVQVSYTRRCQLIVREIQHFEFGKILLCQTRDDLYIIVLEVDIDEGFEVA